MVNVLSLTIDLNKMKAYSIFCWLIVLSTGTPSFGQCTTRLLTEADSGIKFILTCGDTALVSDKDGLLTIVDKTKARYGDSTAIFRFFDSEDTVQLYRPAFVSQPRRLKEFCNQKLSSAFSECRTTLHSTVDGKGVRFKLECSDTTLISDNDGVLTILEKTKSKYGNTVFEFAYFDDLGLTRYRKPALATTTHLLKEFCRQKMGAVPRN